MNNVITIQNKTMREALLNRPFEIFEVKQLAELEDQFKAECKSALCAYRSWKTEYKNETDVTELLYSQLRGMILRAYAENTVRAYWVVRQDFRLVFQRYLNENTVRLNRKKHSKIA